MATKGSSNNQRSAPTTAKARASARGGKGAAKTRSAVTGKVASRSSKKVASVKLAAAKGNKTAFPNVLKSVLSTVPVSAREGFVKTVTDSPADGLDAALWGPGPSPAESRQAALDNLRRQYEARRQVVESSLTRTQVAGLLGISEQAVLDRLDAGDLVGLKQGREWRLPAWQFSADAERGFVPGLAQLRQVFPGGPVSMTEWATSPNVELDGATPAEALSSGHVDAVVHIAAIGTAAAW